MSIDPARIEAAARAIYEAWRHARSEPTTWDELVSTGHSFVPLAEAEAKAAIEAAFPELVPEIFDGLPHAWLAPWEATQTMAFACGTVTPTEANRVWQTMRDAHLKDTQT